MSQDCNLVETQWGTDEIQFMPELWGFQIEKGGWEPHSSEKGEWGRNTPLPFLTAVFWGSQFPSSLSLSNLQSSGINWISSVPLIAGYWGKENLSFESWYNLWPYQVGAHFKALIELIPVSASDMPCLFSLPQPFPLALLSLKNSIICES